MIIESKSKLREKLSKQIIKCNICGEVVYDSNDFEHSKTKRGNEIWVHTGCWNALYGGSIHRE